MDFSRLSHKDQRYPDRLRDIGSPPQQLYVAGELALSGPVLAIVGTRRPTQYGRAVTTQLAFELARAGVTIVSGLALGIDGIAHEAALDAAGVTIAVLAHGLDIIYPSAHRALAKRITANGALVSEYEPGTTPFPQNFVARNRIVAGLSDAVLVPEADAKSGSLITANFALNQGKTVMAVPGNITSPRSAGPNNLIKAGAIAVTDASDVLATLGYESGELAHPVKADSREEAVILELLQQGVNRSQDLIESSGLSASQFANVITLMEISGKVRNLGAGQWLRR